MPHDESLDGRHDRARPRVRVLWDVESWSAVDKALVVIALTLPFRLANAILGTLAQRQPDRFSFLDAGFVASALPFVWGFVIWTIGCALVGLALRVRRPESGVFVWVVIHTFWINNAVISCSVGTLEAPFWIVLVGGAGMMHLLFGLRRSYAGMASGLLVLAIGTAFERAGLLRYAPVFSDEGRGPDGRAVGPWLAMVGGHLIVITAVVMVLVHYYIIRLRDREEALEALTRTDPLTGIPNRRAFTERCAVELARCRRQGGHLSLVMVDVDRFKGINDRFGHAAGDAALKVVAGALQSSIRTEDMAARVGGEEFALLLPATGKSLAVTVAERCRQRVATSPVRLHGATLELTATFGVASSIGTEADTVDALMKSADEALYAGKAAGRNRVEVASRAAEEGDP